MHGKSAARARVQDGAFLCCTEWESGQVYEISPVLYLLKQIPSLDKLYITQNEWSNWFGGARTRQEEVTFKKLPFGFCALSLKSCENPVITPDGYIFELLKISHYIKTKGRHPVTNEPLDIKSLIPIDFAKDKDDRLVCPVTGKPFHENMHIVAVKSSRQVYSKEALDNLDEMKDFVTGELYTKEDLVELQNPNNLEKLNMIKFYHLKEAAATILKKDDGKGINASSSNREGDTMPLKSKGKVAASLTSTFMTPVTTDEYVVVDEETRMFKSIKSNGRAIMQTNFGDLTFELECEKAPKTCYNFISLARKGYYAGVKFHRLVPGFVIQGGDPSGEGTGGESTWGKPFDNEIHPLLTHSCRGILSMANKGTPCTNTSQFFITFAAKKHLDKIHPVFGRLIAGDEVLAAIEAVPQENSRPLKDIVIKDVVIMVDPFEEYQKANADRVGLAEKRRRAAAIDPTLVVKRAKAATNTAFTIGKYLKKA